MPAIEIDFEVYSSPYYLKVRDISVWGLIETKPAIIEIIVPGYSSPITKFYDKNKLNVLNSSMLGLNCEGQEGLTTLPDGIYTLKVIGSPETFFKEGKYLKTDLHDMEVDKIFIENFKDIGKEVFDKKMTRIEFLKRSAEAHLRYDNIEMASSLFTLAQEEAEDILKCVSCE